MNYKELEKVNLERMRRERVEQARAQMEKDGIGAYLCFERSNIQYLTDTYTYRGADLLARNVLFPRNGDPMLYEWGFRWQRVRDELAPWLKGQVYPGWRLAWTLKRGLKPQAFLDGLKKVLNEQGLINEPLAVDMPIMTVNFTDILREEGFNVVDGSASLNRARFRKTQDEVECLKIAVAICDEIFYEIQQAIRPGVRESDLASIVAGTSVRYGCDFACEPVVCSGENTMPNMLGYSDRPIRPGDIVFVDLPGVRWRGYHSCYYRTFSCGRATQRQKELYAETRSLLYKALDKVKAGNSSADVCKAWPGPEHWGGKTWLDTADCVVAHGIGLDNQEAPTITPLFSIDNPVTLEEGMVLALETFYGSKAGEKPRQGCRLEDMLVVTKDGYEMLTRWPEDEITECWI